MGEVINLRLARKRKNRAQQEQDAAAKRRRSGRTQAERANDAAELAREKSALEGKRLDGPRPDAEPTS